MLPLQRWLSPEEAAEVLRPYAAFKQRSAGNGMDVDALVLSDGFFSGAGLFTGGRVSSLRLENTRGSTFIDGDLVVDGWLENPGGLVFVRGNLIAHTVYTSEYLVILGDLRVRRLFGEDEPLGTCVFGDAHVESAIFSHNHQFNVWGTAHLGEEVHDEVHGREALRKRLVDWGLLSDPRQEAPLDVVRLGLRGLAESWGPLSDELASLRYTPKPSDLIAEPPVRPPRPDIILELEQWFASTPLPQRQQLEALRTQWLARLSDSTVRAEAERVIRKHLNSKKLITDRDALLRDLG
ncbi:hypothetical protein HUA76_07270 [Myxococcus sp. CA056]|uniref:hypothetical protein n=1 Tax=unclassified Myxococcus TaxID=2648731 RepID=UPI00157A77AC|nr:MULTISPECIES: hypothetical protein [unclassified Myxococcus]NTX10582.1 hypothetical protein [Myxococcus sp. CA056]NTX38217.1 hypothetical protein [Myxococcus sp. CA033]